LLSEKSSSNFVEWLNKKIELKFDSGNAEVFRFPNSIAKLCNKYTSKCEEICVIPLSKVHKPVDQLEHSFSRSVFQTDINLEQCSGSA
jgi:hypothetical protein